MNIETLAESAGLVTGENMRRDGYMLYRSMGETRNIRSDHLQRFAALVRDQAIEEAARLIDDTWLASPGEYAEAIRALVKPPEV